MFDTASAATEGGTGEPGEDPGETFVVGTALAHRPRTGALRVDLGDDGAVLTDGTVLTVDTLVEGVHFDHRLGPADVGWKAVAVNASDIGAMGGTPRWALLALSLPRPLDRPWVEAFYTGLQQALERWQVDLVGGDTTRSPGPVVVSLTMGGQASRPVTRAGALPGDDLWVTGTLGDAAQGFLTGGAGLSWLARPDPPVTFGAALATRDLAHAMMDLSDGLMVDLGRMCRASGVGAHVHPSKLPRGPALAGVTDPLPLQVAFGDDYQLMFAADVRVRGEVRDLAREHGLQVTLVGAFEAGASPRLLGRPWPRPAFRHFEASR